MIPPLISPRVSPLVSPRWHLRWYRAGASLTRVRDWRCLPATKATSTFETSNGSWHVFSGRSQ
eukprot:7261528-Prymnesium_polylepis.1